METVITRDTDIIREYLSALDARERGSSPFAKFAAVTKLARLQRQLNSLAIDSTEDDIAELRREIDERINRSAGRRFLATRWGGRSFALATLIVGQQFVLLLALLATLLFIQLAPVSKRWNPVLPFEQPGFLYVFIFLFFFTLPVLALLLVFGGRYFRAWKLTAPATVLILLLSMVLTFLTIRHREDANPVRHQTSLELFASRERDVTVAGYRQWADGEWLLRDPQFQHDYEAYLRDGPGRWFTSRLDSDTDDAWKPRNDDSDAIRLMSSYLDSGQDQNGFRDWLRYYFDRHRIYSEDRIDQEVSAITSLANQRYLGIWQMEPFLKERDQRLYRAYLGSIERAMKGWGSVWFGVLSLAFIAGYLISVISGSGIKVSSGAGGSGAAVPLSADSRAVSPSASPGSRYWFPERAEINSPPFFDAPFKVLSTVHRAFLRRVVFVSVLAFLLLALIYVFQISGSGANPASQVDLMRSAVLMRGHGDASEKPVPPVRATTSSTSYVTVGRAAPGATNTRPDSERRSREAVTQQVTDLQQQFDENDYLNSRRFKEQYRALAAQKSEIGSLKNQTAQLQQSTTGLPEQLSDLGSRTSAAEAHAGQVSTEVAAARQTADQLNTKLKDVETRASRAADQVGRVESQVSTLATRTEALDRELETRARQIEARTEELGERTQGLKDISEKTQRIAFNAILQELTTSIDELDRRVATSFYRFMSKGDARRDADALSQRIASLTAELRELNTEQAAQWISQLDQLTARIQDITGRMK